MRTNANYPIEVIPEDDKAVAFVHATLAKFGVATARFEASPSETYSLMAALIKGAERQGFTVVTKPSAGATKVFVSRARRNPEESCSTISHQRLKEDPAVFRRETIPGGFQEDEEAILEYGHCKKCYSTLALETLKRNGRCPRCGKSKYFCECGEARTNPPSWVRDEDVWERATARVKPRWKQYKEPYAAVTDLYFRMGGRKR